MGTLNKKVLNAAEIFENMGEAQRIAFELYAFEIKEPITLKNLKEKTDELSLIIDNTGKIANKIQSLVSADEFMRKREIKDVSEVFQYSPIGRRRGRV